MVYIEVPRLEYCSLVVFYFRILSTVEFFFPTLITEQLLQLYSRREI